MLILWPPFHHLSDCSHQYHRVKIYMPNHIQRRAYRCEAKTLCRILTHTSLSNHRNTFKISLPSFFLNGFILLKMQLQSHKVPNPSLYQLSHESNTTQRKRIVTKRKKILNELLIVIDLTKRTINQGYDQSRSIPSIQ